eukprot:314388-Rhodomonas_salina.3
MPGTNLLYACDAMPGTKIAHADNGCYVMSSTDVVCAAHACAVQCPVLTQHMVLPARKCFSLAEEHEIAGATCAIAYARPTKCPVLPEPITVLTARILLYQESCALRCRARPRAERGRSGSGSRARSRASAKRNASALVPSRSVPALLSGVSDAKY